MKLKRISVLEGRKEITGFSPGVTRFPPYLKLKITCLTADLSEHLHQLKGFVDILHTLPGGEKDVRRIHFTKEDFLENTASFYISTGDLINRIRIGFFFELPIGTLMEQELSEVEAKEVPEFPYPNLRLPLDFLEYIRTLPVNKFRWLISKGIDKLKAPSIQGSLKDDFLKWCFVDRTIRSWAIGELSSNYLDWAACNYSGSYGRIKDELGIDNNLED